VSSLGLSYGDHQFSFYAASAGRVSAAASQTIKIIRSSVLIPVRSGSGTSFFNVWGLSGSSTIWMTHSDYGFLARLRLSGAESDYLFNEDSFSGITLTFHYFQISDVAVLVVFKMTNGNSESAVVDLACRGDLDVQDNDYAPMYNLDMNRGFFTKGNTYGF
jgi:hypothetical protein